MRPRLTPVRRWIHLGKRNQVAHWWSQGDFGGQGAEHIRGTGVHCTKAKDSRANYTQCLNSLPDREPSAVPTLYRNIEVKNTKQPRRTRGNEIQKVERDEQLFYCVVRGGMDERRRWALGSTASAKTCFRHWPDGVRNGTLQALVAIST